MSRHRSRSRSRSRSRRSRRRPIRACLPIGDVPGAHGDVEEAVIGLRDKWANGQTLKVYFWPNVTRRLADRTLAKMQEWSQFANISFAKTKDIGDSDLRVTFEKGGSWSYLGNQAKMLPGKPTMNFGWLTETTDDQEFNRVVLHETGHALGLKHEHQHPTNDIPWNKNACIKYYQRQGWTPEMVEQQVLARTDAQGSQFTAYDPTSIMEYPIPAELVTDKQYAVGWNTRLSDTDKQFIGEQYPIAGSSRSTKRRRRRRDDSSASSSSDSDGDYTDDDYDDDDSEPDDYSDY